MAAHGAAKVSAYVTHGVFPKRSWERFTHKDGKYLHYPILAPLAFELILIFIAFLISISESSEKAFSYFWITDSCPLTVNAIANKAPFEVLSLAGSIADGLQI